MVEGRTVCFVPYRAQIFAANMNTTATANFDSLERRYVLTVNTKIYFFSRYFGIFCFATKTIATIYFYSFLHTHPNLHIAKHRTPLF